MICIIRNTEPIVPNVLIEDAVLFIAVIYMKNKDLKRRILDISYIYKLSHLGSCLTAVDIIDEIYATKKPDEKFVLSSGHAGLALYSVLEKYIKPKDLGDGVKDFRTLLDAENIWLHHGTHPDRCNECHIDCSAGSLGQGLPIAVGMALADRSKNVYCLISDGECSEGSIWEALRIAKEQKLENLRLYINWNGWAAYKQTDLDLFLKQSAYWSPNKFVYIKRTNVDDFYFLKGQDAHYHVMTEEEYKEGLKLLE